MLNCRQSAYVRVCTRSFKFTSCNNFCCLWRLQTLHFFQGSVLRFVLQNVNVFSTQFVNVSECVSLESEHFQSINFIVFISNFTSCRDVLSAVFALLYGEEKFSTRVCCFLRSHPKQLYNSEMLAPN